MYTNGFVAKSGSTAMPSTPRSDSELTLQRDVRRRAQRAVGAHDLDLAARLLRHQDLGSLEGEGGGLVEAGGDGDETEPRGLRPSRRGLGQHHDRDEDDDPCQHIVMHEGAPPVRAATISAIPSFTGQFPMATDPPSGSRSAPGPTDRPCGAPRSAQNLETASDRGKRVGLLRVDRSLRRHPGPGEGSPLRPLRRRGLRRVRRYGTDRGR